MGAPHTDPLLAAADILDPPNGDDLELAATCARSLPAFIREAWPIVEPATPFVHGWHLDVVAHHLEAVTAGELPRLIINVPPRTMKSLTASVFWPAWEWLSSPHIRWLFASYAQDLSTRDSVKCRRLIESRGGRQDGTLFQRLGYHGVSRLLGDAWELTGDQNVKTKYETTRTGMRLATSVGGIATGEGGDRIVVDDPLSAKQARSEKEREAANTWWGETMTTRFNNASAAAVIVMQRLHEDDLTGHLLASDSGWHHLCLPGEYEPSHPFIYPPRVVLRDRQITVQGDDGQPESLTIPGGRILPGDPRTQPGELLDPVRLSADRLSELRKPTELGSYGFAGQIQQLPAPTEGGMFQRDWWQYWTPGTLPPQWQRMVASWDMRFSDSQKQESSFVVGQVWGIDGADRYLIGQIRARLSFTESLKAVKALAAWKPAARAKLVERKANGAAVIDTLKGKVAGLIPIEPEGGKDVRASAVQPFVEAGNVYLPAADFIPCPPGYTATATQAFVEELAVFPNGTHDDQVDAFSQALNWLEHHDAPATTEPYMDGAKDTVRRTGDLVLVGDHYIDQQ